MLRFATVACTDCHNHRPKSEEEHQPQGLSQVKIVTAPPDWIFVPAEFRFRIKFGGGREC